MKAAQLAGYVPIGLYWQDGAPLVDWVYLGDARFEEPFFQDTIQRCLRRPFSVFFRPQTPIDALGEVHAVRPGLPPSGFIFHMSRCGSTLVSQMLAALPQHVVISEAAPIDAVLRTPCHHARDIPDAGHDPRVAWLQWMVSALGQRRSGAEERLFVKFDAWSTLSLPLIERAFPGVPWIFLYRDPVAVLVSQTRQRGVQLVPGIIEPELFGMDIATAVAMGADEYAARVLATICEGALGRLRQGSGMAVNYTSLPGAVSSIAAGWGVPLTVEDRARMARAAQFDAKRPSFVFADDAAAKAREASPLTRQLADRWLRPLHDELDALAARRRLPGSLAG